MTKNNRESIFAARDAVLEALGCVAAQIEDPFVGGTWWLTPRAALAEARDYALVFGRDHLREWSDATAELAERDAVSDLFSCELFTDLNSGCSLIGLSTLLLADASARLLAIDWAPAAGELLLLLASKTIL